MKYDSLSTKRIKEPAFSSVSKLGKLTAADIVVVIALELSYGST